MKMFSLYFCMNIPGWKKLGNSRKPTPAEMKSSNSSQYLRATLQIAIAVAISSSCWKDGYQNKNLQSFMEVFNSHFWDNFQFATCHWIET